MLLRKLPLLALTPLLGLALSGCPDPTENPTSGQEETGTPGSIDPTQTELPSTPPETTSQTQTQPPADTPTQPPVDTPTASGTDTPATPTHPPETDPPVTPTAVEPSATGAPGTSTEPPETGTPATPTAFATPTAIPDTPTAIPDGDGDGYLATEDCDDGNAEVNPGATEICNDIDDDCDTLVDDDDDVANPPAWYVDGDGDTYGAGEATLACVAPDGAVDRDGDCDDADAIFYPGAPEDDCTDPNDYNCDGQTGYADSDGDDSAACEDCNDSDASIFPGADERCDEVDQDCDTVIDEGVQTTFYVDGDGDGFGVDDDTTLACEVPEGFAATDDDCDDGEALVNPNAEEACDGADQDCDGQIDEGVQATYYADTDGDGYGDPDDTADACEAPDGYVQNASDCDPESGGSYPGADEVEDAADNDCDEIVDEGTAAYDDDGDGFSENDGDCDDTSAEVNPDAEEAENGIDDNCDGTVDEGTDAYDDDGDGFSENAGDCNDDDASVFPGQPGCGYDFGAENCSEILYAGDSVGDGYYLIDPDGDGGSDGFTVYCDMSTDGGGWTLMGTIAGGDDDHWNTEFGYWADDQTLGSLETAFEADFKSEAWSESDTVAAEVMVQRVYDGLVRSRVVMDKACLGGARSFSDRFSTVDVSRACEPHQLRVIESSSVGVTNGTYAEGESYGLGGSGTNGFCWFGEDTESNVFQGHLYWNQYPGSETCKREGHLGGVGVYWNNSGQYENKDITDTNWLYETDHSLTVLSLFTRTPHPSDRDDDGFTAAAGDCDDRDPSIYPGSSTCAFEVGGDSCSDIYHQGLSQGDGVYLVTNEDGEGYEVFCNMTVEGGGWTLLGTVSGGDADRFNTEFGHWSSDSTFGDLFDPFGQDYKSPTWSQLDAQFGEILVQRRYNGALEGESVLGRPCMGYHETFSDVFSVRDTDLACEPSDIRTIRSSAVGVYNSTYAEGESYGLGGSNTNGFCWFGEDTESNVFRGHIFWNQYPGSQTCKREGHLGGIGVFWENSSQYQTTDITTTNWLYETNTTLTDISFYVRTPNPVDRDADGVTPEEGDCDDRDPAVYPGTSGCPWDVGGDRCADIMDAGSSLGDGVYLITPDGGPAIEAWCDMSTDGGGWTLLGTVSGGDSDSWNVEFGPWSDENQVGSLFRPFDQDYKGPTWNLLDITGSEVLVTRRFNDAVEGQSILTTPCLNDQSYFADLFAVRDDSLACLPTDIVTVSSSAVGVYNSTYAEGESYGLGGSGTNGFCWFGEDTESNVFRGHIFWNQYPGSGTCKREGHLGGIGVFWENSSQYQVKDITGVNWLYETDYTATDISFFAR